MKVRFLNELLAAVRCLLCVGLLMNIPVWALAETDNDTPENNDGNATQVNDNKGDNNEPDNKRTDEQEQPPLPRVAANPQRERQQGLQRFLREQGRQHEIVPMVANETEFYGLFLRESRGQPQGGILLLHDQQQHGHWPTLIAPLREYLPPLGWTTLAIELASPPPLPIPERGVYEVISDSDDLSNEDENDGDQNNEAVANDDIRDNNTVVTEPLDSNGLALTGTPELDNISDNEPALPRLERLPPPRPWANDNVPSSTEQDERTPQQRYEADMHARIETAMRYLQQRGQLNLIIIASGESANWAAAYVQKNRRNDQERGLGLILVDAMDDPWHTIPLTQQVAELDIPMLDIITALNRQPPFHNQRRAGTMRHKQRDQYQQLVLPAYDHYHETSSLLNRRIQGWLRTHMKGSEMKAGG